MQKLFLEGPLFNFLSNKTFNKPIIVRAFPIFGLKNFLHQLSSVELIVFFPIDFLSEIRSQRNLTFYQFNSLSLQSLKVLVHYVRDMGIRLIFLKENKISCCQFRPTFNNTLKVESSNPFWIKWCSETLCEERSSLTSL